MKKAIFYAGVLAILFGCNDRESTNIVRLSLGTGEDVQCAAGTGSGTVIVDRCDLLLTDCSDGRKYYISCSVAGNNQDGGNSDTDIWSEPVPMRCDCLIDGKIDSSIQSEVRCPIEPPDLLEECGWQ